jgi:hypothetical protein
MCMRRGIFEERIKKTRSPGGEARGTELDRLPVP